MNQMLEQIQEKSKQRMLDKASILVQNKRVRRSPCKESRNIWMVSSYSTRKKWYVVKWDEDINGFVCGCRAWLYSSDNVCLHVMACALAEGGEC